MSGLAQIIGMPRAAIALQFRLVVIDRFGLVMSQARAERVLGLLEGNEPWPRAGRLFRGVKQAEIALRPDMEDPISGALHQADRHVARGDDAVERLGRNPKLQHLALDGRRGPRSVGDQDDRAAPAPERNQRLRGWREGSHAIVHDAPDVAKNRFVAVGDFAETANPPDNLRLFLPHRRPLG